MSRRIVSDKQKIAIMILFLSGSTSIFAPGLEAKKDAWLAVILAMIAAIPMICIYARLHYIFQDKNLFDIIEICFGSIIGKITIIMFIWYTFYWATDVLNNYGFYIVTVSMHNTPKTILIGFMSILCIWAMKEGVNLIGEWSKLFVTVPYVILIIIMISVGKEMNINNIKPIMYFEDINALLKGAFSVFSQPFVQCIAFTMIFSDFENKKSPYNIYLKSLIIASIYMTLLTLTNILVLGENAAINAYYPAYETARKINIGYIIQRIEVLISVSFILGGFVKVSILLLCGCKGIAKVFKCSDYRFIIVPYCLLVINFSYFQYDSVMNYMEFNSKIWPYYFFPFQIIVPIILWVIAEIKSKAFDI